MKPRQLSHPRAPPCTKTSDFAIMSLILNIYMKKNIAVIGAGIAGLTAAYELQKAGHTVEVFERDAFVGGRMSTRTKDDLPFDIGANHLVNLYTEMKAYCEELKVAWHPLNFVHYNIFKDGKLMELFDSLSLKDKLMLPKAYLKYKNIPVTFLDSSTLVEYDNGNAYDTAVKEIGQTFADNIVDTYVGVYQFHRATEISRAGLLSQLNSTHQQTEKWFLQRTTGGMITLPQAMADTLTVHMETPVTEITAHDTGVTVKTDTESKEFDSVVLATTATAANKIYKNPTEGQKSVMEQAKYASSIIVAFKMPVDQFGPATGDTSDTISAVWIPYSESKILSSYSNESEKGPELIKDGKTLLLAFMREDGADEYMNKSDEEIYDIAKKEMMRLCPFINEEDVLENHDLYKWDEAMPKFYEGSLTAVKQFLDTEQGAQNVWFAADYLNAPWTAGALRMGQRVAKQIDSTSE